MANPMKGEAPLGEYTLTINFGVFCALEDEMGKNTDEILGLMLNGLTFTQLRTVIRASLQPQHPGIPVDEVETAIDTVGGYMPAYLALGKAIKAYTGEQKAKAKNPPKAA